MMRARRRDWCTTAACSKGASFALPCLIPPEASLVALETTPAAAEAGAGVAVPWVGLMHPLMHLCPEAVGARCCRCHRGLPSQQWCRDLLHVGALLLEESPVQDWAVQPLAEARGLGMPATVQTQPKMGLYSGRGHRTRCQWSRTTTISKNCSHRVGVCSLLEGMDLHFARVRGLWRPWALYSVLGCSKRAER